MPDAIRPIGLPAIKLPRCGVEMKITRATSRRRLKINASLTDQNNLAVIREDFV